MELKLTFTKNIPDHQGQFLIKWKEGVLKSSRYETITVYWIPPYYNGGMQFGDYFAIQEWAMKSVEKINMDYVEGIAKLPL